MRVRHWVLAALRNLRVSDKPPESELHRAITGIVSKFETRGDIPHARCNALAEDVFHHGRVVPMEERIAKVQAVSVADVNTYLGNFPRDRLSVLTLGPVSLSG